MDIFSLFVDLVDQGEVEVESLHSFSMEEFHLGLVLLILHVLDHVREPHRQSVVAETQK
jgi:hypothetical protein